MNSSHEEAREPGWHLRPTPRRVMRTMRWLAEVFSHHRRLRREGGLTVAVDIDPLYLPLTGVGWYLRCLLTELAAREDVRLRLYGPALQGSDTSGPHPSAPLPQGAALRMVAHPLRHDLAVSPFWQNKLLRALQPLLIRYDRNCVVFAPNFIVPRRLRWSGGELVVTVHDLAMRRVPETLAAKTKALLDANLQRALARAAHLITPSETVRREVIDEGLFAGHRVHAILHGPGHLAGAAVGADLDAGDDAGNDAVPRGAVLHVGTIEPRKNLALLLDVWEAAQKRGDELPPLLWCGRVGWKSEDLMRRARRGIDAGWLVHRGYVGDEELEALYRSALCVVVPSLYEGFGLPLVEAMSAGAPVVCSDIAVFREVAEDAALLVSLDSHDSWQEAIERLRDDSELRQRLILRGRRRVATLDWRRSAENTLAVWRQAAGRAAERMAER